jgi:hypothetical protein
MINQQKVKSYCSEDISLIENYEKAINDNTQTWHCHHKLETELGLSIKELKELNLYYHIPASELIFLTEYEHIRLHHKGKYVSEETKQKQREANLGKKNPMYGKKQSEESKRKNREAHLDKKHTEETKNKMREVRLGKMRVNDGKQNKYILPEELDQYINSGWSRGYIKKDSN